MLIMQFLFTYVFNKYFSKPIMLGILRVIDLGTFNNFDKVTLYYFFRPKFLVGSSELMNYYSKFYQE